MTKRDFTIAGCLLTCQLAAETGLSFDTPVVDLFAKLPNGPAIDLFEIHDTVFPSKGPVMFYTTLNSRPGGVARRCYRTAGMALAQQAV